MLTVPHPWYAAIWLGALAAIVYLVDHGHPWFAFFILCAVGGISMKGQGQ